MIKRLRNLGLAASDFLGSAGALGLSAVGLLAMVGVHQTYERSVFVSHVSIATLSLVVLSALLLLVSAVSKGETKEERSTAIRSILPLVTVLLNASFVVSMSAYLGGDYAVEYFTTRPDTAVFIGTTAIGVAFCLLASVLIWGNSRIEHLELQVSSGNSGPAHVEETTSRVPSVVLRYTEKDRKRRAAHFAGRVLCFSFSPYLDDHFSFELNAEFSQIEYRSTDQFEDEGFKYWMFFQLLCAEQAEAAFATTPSEISWEFYGDIEHYAIELLSGEHGCHTAMKRPKDSAEVEWRANRVRMYVKDQLLKVHSFLRANQNTLREIVSASMSGSLTADELFTYLQAVDTSHLPMHWDSERDTSSRFKVIS